ncbi:MAG: hypothetical protein ACK5HS_00010 [Mycoplasmatales bacterium]
MNYLILGIIVIKLVVIIFLLLLVIYLIQSRLKEKNKEKDILNNEKY